MKNRAEEYIEAYKTNNEMKKRTQQRQGIPFSFSLTQLLGLEL